jgi:hypothetical protein
MPVMCRALRRELTLTIGTGGYARLSTDTFVWFAAWPALVMIQREQADPIFYAATGTALIDRESQTPWPATVPESKDVLIS